jgi:hypothetical protein
MLNSIFSTCCTTASPTTQEITSRYKKYIQKRIFSQEITNRAVRRRCFSPEMKAQCAAAGGIFFVFLELVPAAPARSEA